MHNINKFYLLTYIYVTFLSCCFLIRSGCVCKNPQMQRVLTVTYLCVHFSGQIKRGGGLDLALTHVVQTIIKLTSLLLSKDRMKSKNGCSPAFSAGELGCTCQQRTLHITSGVSSLDRIKPPENQFLTVLKCLNKP